MGRQTPPSESNTQVPPSFAMVPVGQGGLTMALALVQSCDCSWFLSVFCSGPVIWLTRVLLSASAMLAQRPPVIDTMLVLMLALTVALAVSMIA